MSNIGLKKTSQPKNTGNDTPLITRIMIYVYLILSFYEPYLNGVIGSVTKYYLFVLMIVVLFTAKKISFKKFQVYFVVWFVYKVITLFWTPSFEVAKVHFISQIGMIALVVVLTTIPIDGKTIDGMIKTLWIGSASIGFLSLFFSEPFREDFEARIVLTLFGQQADPNNQAAFVVIGITVSLYFLLLEKKYKALSIAVMLVNIYSLMLTASRGGLIVLIVVAVCFLILNEEKESFKKKLIKWGAVVLFAFALLYIAANFLPETSYERLFDFESYEGGSDRTVIWANGWELLSSNLNIFFGAGWGAYYGFNGFYKAMHNTFLSMLCDVGIIGCAIFFIPIISAAMYMLKKKDILPVALLFTGMIPSIFLDAINKRFFWNAIIFLFILYNYHKSREPRHKSLNERI